MQEKRDADKNSNDLIKRIKKIWDYEIINHAVKLFMLCLCVALMLSVVNALTKERIETLAEEKQKNAMEYLFPEAEFKELEIITELENNDVYGIWEARIGGIFKGYCILVHTAGFGDIIDMAVAVSETEEIINIKIISMGGETPGLGSLASEPEFIEQFIKKTYPINLIKIRDAKENEINSISGATVTSEAVVKGVNIALTTVRRIIHIQETAEIIGGLED